MSATDQLVVGVDFGTLSARAVVARVSDGEVLAAAVHRYRHGVMSESLASSGQALPPNWALQNADDYIESLARSVSAAVGDAGVDPGRVVGLGIDFTACTILPVDGDGVPMSGHDRWASDPHAYVKLWKHHAAQSHADRINALAQARGERWIGRYGGKLSSEWALAKGLQLFEDAPELYAETAALVEAADWVVWALTGTRVRNEALAGYKSARQDGAFPSADFLETVSPGFGSFCATRLDGDFRSLGDCAGQLLPLHAEALGLTPGTPVAVGNVDAHVTAPMARTLGSGQLLAVMGTSTCHILSHHSPADVPGMCGVVMGGVVPGAWGFEAGQSGVGDLFGWFVDNALPAESVEAASAQGVEVFEYLTGLAAELSPGECGLIALDWWSGNRSVLVDHDLSGLLVGLNLSTRPHHIFRALLEATVFGTRVIIESFEDSGVPVTSLTVAGGLASNRLLMQLTADITRLPVHLVDSDQGPALGSAMQAAVAAGAHPDIASASASMSRVVENAYLPDENQSMLYDPVYAEYRRLHDLFAEAEPSMKRLLAFRRAAGGRRRQSDGWAEPQDHVR